MRKTLSLKDLGSSLFQQITFYADRRQELNLRLRRQGQAPELNEAQGSIVIELITAIVRCQAMTIERVLRLTTDNRTLPA